MQINDRDHWTRGTMQRFGSAHPRPLSLLSSSTMSSSDSDNDHDASPPPAPAEEIAQFLSNQMLPVKADGSKCNK